MNEKNKEESTRKKPQGGGEGTERKRNRLHKPAQLRHSYPTVLM
uniref:Uncharacterized protein n=1 Tax=Rhizophora mucronata TaxID=61149 RepID=A0A2P2R4N1_RHIMU